MFTSKSVAFVVVGGFFVFFFSSLVLDTRNVVKFLTVT